MKKHLHIVAVIVLIFSCKVPYQPNLNSPLTSYLVVEGVINTSSTDSTFIKLSRTVGLSSASTTNPELNAQVSVEDGQGGSIRLTELMAKEIPKGTYGAAPMPLNNTKQYRIRIKTSDNKTYLSDLTNVLYTPPIDSVGYYAKDNGIQVYVNTHDPKNNTHYYRWDFTETWKFLPAYVSFYVSNRVAIVLRTPDQMYPKSCWGNDIAKGINVNSSVKLSQDVIYQSPLTYIKGTSEKISLRYSIQVKQYALTKDAYGFWEQLKKNTENLGTIFDAQPSESKSNIHCLENPFEPVVGYMSVSNIQSKRVYFNRGDMNITGLSDEFAKCREDTLFFAGPNGNEVQNILVPGLNIIPTIPYYQERFITGYLATGLQCVDCSTRGAIHAPPFWKDIGF